MPTTIDELQRGRAPAWQWTEFGDFDAVTSGRHGLAAGHPIQCITAVIAQVTHADSCHTVSVPPVIDVLTR